MAEYIERELLVKYLEELEEHSNPDMDSEPMAYGSRLGISYALSLARSLLASDVVEERHGNAICGDHDEWWGAVYECSLCGNKWMLECSSYKAKYCPWCGAKMDGERKGQK